MPILQDKQKEQLTDLFSGLKNEVDIILFTQEFECEHCRITHEMLEDVAGLSAKISLLVKDIVKDAELAKKYGVDKIPAIVILGEKDYGIRFFGVPAGYEFTALIEDIIQVSMGAPRLGPEVTAELEKIDQPVHLQVMISPTCPYCPTAVRAAHRLAMASDKIRADMVETVEFPHLVQKYEVQGVPHTVINDFYSFVGPLPELDTTYEILRALGKPAPPPKVHVHEHEEHDHGHAHQHHARPAGKAGKKKPAAKADEKKPKKK